MPSFLWTFETLTTTGFEPDVDTISGVEIASLGDGSGADAVPCPSVPGETGNGRLLFSGNFYNAFSTEKETAMAHISGNAANLSFQWRPLIDYPGGLAGTSMLYFGLLGYISGGAVGNTYIEVYITSNATVGLYNFSVVVLGFYASPTTTNFTGIPLTLRDWNEIGFNYAGANSIDIVVNGSTIGTVGPTTSPMPTFTHGQLIFSKNAGGSGAVFGVLDTVNLTLS